MTEIRYRTHPLPPARFAPWLAVVLGALLLCIRLSAGDAVVRPANAGGPSPAIPSTLIELDGTISSSPDGDELIYKWRQITGPRVELSDYASPKPYFRTSQPGEYEFELVVSAGGLDSEPYIVNLIIEQENLPPVAKIPFELDGQVGKLLEIDGRESFDPEGEDLSYRWRSLTPGLVLPQSALSRPVLSFEPERDGVYEVELVVSDGEKLSHPAVVRLSIRPRPRPPVARVQIKTLEIPAAPPPELRAMSPPAASSAPPPVARIEGPVAATVGETIMLDARSSVSPTGRPLEFFWRQKSGPFINGFELVFDGGAERFQAPKPGDYEFEVVVSDGDNDSAPVLHRVRVVEELDPPVAVVIAPTRAMPGDLVKMDATQSYDMRGSPLVYKWRQIGGPAVRNYVIDEVLGDSAPAFHPPSAGVYSFELVVSNGKQSSRPIEIDIEVGQVRRAPALAVAGPDAVSVGEQVFLDVSAPNEGQRRLHFVWQQTAGPAIALVQSAGARAIVNPPMPGRYVFDATATENGVAVGTVQRVLEVFNGAAGSGRTNAAPVLVTPPGPVETPAVPARRRVPELTPMPNTTAAVEDFPPAQPVGRGRASAQVMQGGKYGQ